MSNDNCTSNPLEIANIMDEMFAENSSDKNFSTDFLQHKMYTEEHSNLQDIE